MQVQLADALVSCRQCVEHVCPFRNEGIYICLPVVCPCTLNGDLLRQIYNPVVQVFDAPLFLLPFFGQLIFCVCHILKLLKQVVSLLLHKLNLLVLFTDLLVELRCVCFVPFNHVVE